MSPFTGEHRAFAIQAFYENGRSYIVARRKFRVKFNLRSIRQCPSTQLLKQWLKRFQETGSTLPKKRRGRSRTVRTVQAIEEVNQSVEQNAELSTRRRSAAMGISRSSLQRILHDLKLHPYKIQLVQQLKPDDHTKRERFSSIMLERFSNFRNILFSDEAHFHLSGFVNKQNCRYWSAEQPSRKHQKPLHCQKVTVWAAVSARGLIGPYFFENSSGQALTVNTERYVKMLKDFLRPTLAGLQEYNSLTWFQQDGATCHTSNASMEVVKEMFPGKVISKRGDIEWPPRSPDLSPPDFFLWGYLKNKVYSNKPETITALKENIRTEMAAISTATCQRVFENFKHRLEECSRREGAHLDDVIFKK